MPDDTTNQPQSNSDDFTSAPDEGEDRNLPYQTPDDAFESEREEDDGLFKPDQVEEEKLPNDYGTPTSPADDSGETISQDDQRTDTDIDAHDRYDAGDAVAAGVGEREDLDEDAISPLDPTDDDEAEQ